MPETHSMTSSVRSHNDDEYVGRQHNNTRSAESQWWEDVRYGMNTYIKKRQVSERYITIWGLFGVVVFMVWIAFSETSSLFWTKMFGAIIISDCLYGDGCLLGRKTKMPDWVDADNLRPRRTIKRGRRHRVWWRNMYGVSSDEN